ncbi:carbohydrate-binding module family 1 protein [Apiospora saccharicola]
MQSSFFYLRLATAVAVFTSSLASGFKQASQDNMAVYWGQNFEAGGQQRLSTYCGSAKFNIIPIAFLVSLTDPVINLANGNANCTTFPGVAEDIKTCQSKHGKTVMLSIGGSTYNEGGFGTPSQARAAADKVWNLFGPNTRTADRPFGSAVVDGFDFDLESPTRNMVPFAQRLRELMDAAPNSKRYYLSAAPQCPFPDVADGEMLAGQVGFDFVMVQFYNNYCGVQSFVASAASAFNLAAWDAWARGNTSDGSRGSKNPDVKILLGVPASRAAASTGFLEPALLKPVVEYAATFSSFGGVMMWDMSHLYSSAAGSFLDDVHGALSRASSPKMGHDRATSNANTDTTTTSPLPAEGGNSRNSRNSSRNSRNSSSTSRNSTSSSNGAGTSSSPITTSSASTTGIYHFSSTAWSWSGLALGVAFHSFF